jgi:cytochrome c biogenesis protein CcmG, thiol:disulfide interchange protein DsbE
VPPGAEAMVVTTSDVGAPPGHSRDRVFKWIAAVAGAFLVGFIAFVIVRGPSHPSASGTAALKVAPPPVLKAGTPAPAFSLPALRGGDPVTLAAYQRTPVIVNFFASWCPDCRQELAAMATVAREAGGRVAVIGVDSNETSTDTTTRLLAAAGATYPVALDAGATVASRYLVAALPVSYFVDAKGTVVGAALGPQSASSLERWAARLEGRG